MITSFEVGAVFKIINEGSPAIRKRNDELPSFRYGLVKRVKSMKGKRE